MYIDIYRYIYVYIYIYKVVLAELSQLPPNGDVRGALVTAFRTAYIYIYIYIIYIYVYIYIYIYIYV